MKRKVLRGLLSILIFLALGLPCAIFANADLSMLETDITFSEDEPLEGQTIRIFTRIFNVGDEDMKGFIEFLIDGKKFSDPQPISVKVNTYDDVFVSWTVKSGNYKVESRIVGITQIDDNPDNNEVIKKEIFVDLDSDGDGIGNAKDLDDDNDGTPDDQEIIIGTSPIMPDTDGDDINDNIDVFPLDSTEWRDTDSNEIGDNEDQDDDGDGISDDMEIRVYGTNPLNHDTDGDGLSDAEEIKIGTDPLNADTDGDGTSDGKDGFPLDPKLGTASLLDSVIEAIGDRYYVYAIIGVLVLIICFLLFRRKKKR